MQINNLTVNYDGTVRAFLSWETKNPRIASEMAADLQNLKQNIKDCICIVSTNERARFYFTYSGRYYAAQADTDYRIPGMKKMNTPINITHERPSKSHAAAKAATVMLTPFTVTIDALMLPAYPIIHQGLKGVPHG